MTNRLRDLRLWLACWLMEGSGWMPIPESQFQALVDAYTRETMRALDIPPALVEWLDPRRVPTPKGRMH